MYEKDASLNACIMILENMEENLDLMIYDLKKRKITRSGCIERLVNITYILDDIVDVMKGDLE